MTTPPRRPTLHLKPGVTAPDPWKPEPLSRPKPLAAAARKPRPPAPPKWKCKPCGASFTPSFELQDGDYIRCPDCNARLGLAADFRSDPPAIEKLRARLLKG